MLFVISQRHTVAQFVEHPPRVRDGCVLYRDGSVLYQVPIYPSSTRLLRPSAVLQSVNIQHILEVILS